MTLAGGAGSVLVVAADDERRSQYESALQRARLSAHVTVDAGAAESAIGDAAPDVLVLDRGLRRLVLFQLFSLVRADAADRPTRVVFVGQDGDTGPDDHYLPGEPSAQAVVEHVSELLGRARPVIGVSAPEAPLRSRSRLDVILIGVGLVLLILGGALWIFVQS